MEAESGWRERGGGACQKIDVSLGVIDRRTSVEFVSRWWADGGVWVGD